MEKFQPYAAVMGLILSSGFSVEHGITPDEFDIKSLKFRHGKITPRAFKEICQEALDSRAGRKTAYRLAVYARFWEACMLDGDPAEAASLARLVMSEFPSSPLGFMLMSDTRALLVDLEQAVIFLREAEARTIDQRDRQRLARRIEDMPFRINNVMNLWADWDEDPVRAEMRHKNKKALARGIVTSLIEMEDGKMVAAFEVKRGKRTGVYCIFPEVDCQGISPGRAAAIFGTCRGLSGKIVLLTDCETRPVCAELIC